MLIQIKIGLRIKELREKQNLKQEQLAWQAGVDRTYMNYVENGKRNITVKNLEKIVADGLKMRLSDFFNDSMFNEEKN
ncbi:MAG: helix-turn-helix transcriptional regulator [Bacteroidales bacterium]|nr:helix-turn-helix transcriptional regulator [Bacteroidales bacterium]